MNRWTFIRLLLSVTAAGFIIAGVLVVTYLLDLPIFDRTGMAWCLFWALVAAGIALLALIVRWVWDGPNQ